MTSYPRVLPVGDSALTLELGNSIDAGIAARVAGVDRLVREGDDLGVLETVATYRSLLVIYDKRVTDVRCLGERILALCAKATADSVAGRLIEIETTYDGEDLPELELALKMSRTDIAECHSRQEYRVFMLGFSPGFAYMGLLDARIETPRRKTPRTRVPAGSVAIAGAQTGVYPRVLPGGWNLIGRTGKSLFDPPAAVPSLLLPGDRVRFVQVEDQPTPSVTNTAATLNGDALRFLEPGICTTVQDGGRVGLRRIAVPFAGFADRAWAKEANRAVGNSPDEALFELDAGGVAIEFLSPTLAALCGDAVEATLERQDLGPWKVPSCRGFRTRAGNVLRIAAFRGRRAYLAIAGLKAPELLGSASVDEGSGILRRVQAGDCFSASSDSRSLLDHDSTGAMRGTVRVVLGPQDDHFSPETIASFLGGSWRVGLDSNRVGSRLDGLKLAHSGPSEIVSDGMVPGCIQVPPDGRPIVMLRDCPTTGGYPKIATVVTDDIDIVARTAPRGVLRFEAVTLA